MRTFTTAGFLVVVVAPHVVALRQTGARAPFSFSFRLLPNQLVLPEFVQPADSVHQTRPRSSEGEDGHFLSSERRREGESGIYPFSVCPCTRLKGHLISARHHFAVLAGSSNFLLCSFSSANNTLMLIFHRQKARHLFSLRPLNTLAPCQPCHRRNEAAPGGGHPGRLILFGPICRAVTQQKVYLSPGESPRTITTSCL